jgi:Fic family protein
LEGNTLTLGETRSLILHSYKVTIDKKLKDIEEMKSHIGVYREAGLPLKNNDTFSCLQLFNHKIS